jgi:hypothetical protein
MKSEELSPPRHLEGGFDRRVKALFSLKMRVIENDEETSFDKYSVLQKA